MRKLAHNRMREEIFAERNKKRMREEMDEKDVRGRGRVRILGSGMHREFRTLKALPTLLNVEIDISSVA
jgi:hypothetical protein